MKVIQRGKVVDGYPKRVICESCGTELEYEKNDVSYGEFGCGYVICPVCKNNQYLDDEETVLHIDNVVFPDNFAHTDKHCVNLRGDSLTPDNVIDNIKRAIESLRKDGGDYYTYSCGNLHLVVTLDDESNCYHVVVTNDFYETIIDFDDDDYVEYGRRDY